MALLNYAEQYSRALANSYAGSLYFGDLWTAPNKDVYKIVNAKTIQIPTLEVGDLEDGDRDTIGTFKRNFNNDFETKELKGHKVWETLVHPKDIEQTNYVATIGNITKTMNETKKFPYMDSLALTSIYNATKTVKSAQIETLESDLTIDTVLTKFDELMDKMDEAEVPMVGRTLYVDTATKTLIDNCKDIYRVSGTKVLGRAISRIDEVEVKAIPSNRMKVADGQVKMFLIHKSAIIPAINYEFAGFDTPKAITGGKYVYFEEFFADMFILNKKVDAIAFVIKGNV